MVDSTSSPNESFLERFKRRLGLNSLPVRAENTGPIDAAPFIPLYARNERIYRVADWTSNAPGSSAYPSSSAAAGSRHGAVLSGDEEDWSMSAGFGGAGASSGASKKPGRSARGVLPPRGGASGGSAGSGARGRNSGPTGFANGPRAGMHATAAKKLGWGGRTGYDRQKTREASIRIDPSWSLLEEIEFSRISKLQYEPEEEPHLLKAAGQVRFYNKALDRVSTKSTKLVSIEDVSLPSYVQVVEDHNIRKLVEENCTGAGSIVAMSDAVAALLMATPRTVFPWDLVIKRETRQECTVLLIDQRPEAHLNWSVMGETSNDPPSEDREQFNSAAHLALETARIDALLPTLISNAEDIKVIGETSASLPPSIAYQYHLWDMGEGVKMIIRSQVNGASRLGSEEKIVLVKGLLEYTGTATGSRYGTGSVDWRSKLDNQRGAVLVAEIKNNNALIARWVFQAILARVDMIKLAWIARVSPNDRVRHELLNIQDLEPDELANQMSLNTANGFGILKALLDLFIELDSKHLVLVRDPSKPLLRIYDAAIA
jgi:translation initiation factor 3 subunit D